MSIDSFLIIVVYGSISVLYTILMLLGDQLRFGIIGVILIIQPVAMMTYSDFNPWITLAAVVIGIIVLIADLRRAIR